MKYLIQLSLITILLLFYSCDNEDLSSIEQENQLIETTYIKSGKDSKKYTVPLSDLIEKETISSFIDKMGNNNKSQNKTDGIKIKGYDVLTDNVIVYESENYKSYTFNLYKKSETDITGNISNLLVEFIDGKLKATLLLYEIDRKSYLDYLATQRSPLKGSVKIKEIKSKKIESLFKSENCFTIFIEVIRRCTCGGNHSPEQIGSCCCLTNCNGCSCPYHEVYPKEICGGSGGDSDGILFTLDSESGNIDGLNGGGGTGTPSSNTTLNNYGDETPELIDEIIENSSDPSTLVLPLSYIHTLFCDNPSFQDFQNDQDGTYLNRLKVAIASLRQAGYDWFADMVQELIDCNEFQTVGDLVDTYKMVREFISEVNNYQVCIREQEVATWMMAIFSPENVGIISASFVFSPNMSTSYRARFLTTFSAAAANLSNNLSKGYLTFNAFKSAAGNAGTNKAWHHIVEQNQIANSGFNPRRIHNPYNLVKIESGFSGSWHSRITSAFATNGRYAECGGQSLRNWLVGKPFEVQYQWGLRVMREVKP